jgi:hypothetical protein
MQAPTHVVAHVPVAYTTGDGELLSREVKVYRFGDAKLYWSVQHLFLCFFQNRTARLDTNKECGRQQFDLEVYCEALQQDATFMVEKNFRSHTASQTEPNCRTVKEFTISTLGMLLLLAMWASGRKEVASREKAVLLLAALLAGARIVQACTFQVISVVVSAAAALCTVNSQGGRCRHLRQGLDLLQAGDHCPQLALARCIERWSAHHLHCPSCCHAVKLVAQHLAHRIQESWSTWTTSAADHDRVVDHRGKKLQHDQDYKQSLKDRVLKRRKCSTIKAVTDMKGSGRNVSRYWATADLERYQMAAWRELSELSGTFVLQEDAARLGQPAQETETLILHHVGSQKCAILPPQVGPAQITCIQRGFTKYVTVFQKYELLHKFFHFLAIVATVCHRRRRSATCRSSSSSVRYLSVIVARKPRCNSSSF